MGNVFSPMILEYSGKIPSSFDKDAVSFINIAGINTWLHQKTINDLVKDLKKTGVWGKLTAVYPFIGGNANAHSYNLKKPEKYRFVWGDLAEHSTTGVVPHKQGHLFKLKMSEINSNAGNNLSISIYLYDDGNSSSQTGDIVTMNSSTKHTAIYKYNNGNIRFDNGIYTNGNTITVPRKKMSGFFNGIALENKLYLYQNGELLGSKSHTPIDVQELELQYHYDSATIDNKSQCRFLSIGNALTDDEIFLLNGVIQKYQAKLDRAFETDEAPDTDVSAFIEAAKIKDSDQLLAINYLTRSLKSAGLWDKFTTLYPLVGGTYDSCKYNLIDIAQNILSNAEGVVYSKKGIMPNNNVEIGSFNNLFPNYNANLESSFDMYIQEDIESTTHDLGFEDTKNGFCIFSNYTGREVYYLSAYTGGNNVTEEKRISKIVNVPTNGLFSGQSKTGNLSVYKNGKVLISETKTPQNIPDYPVFIMKNIRTLSLVATRKSNLTDAEFITYNNIIRTYQRILNRDVNYEAETEAFVQASGISDITYKKNIDIFIKDLKTEGLFEKFYALYLYSGIAFDKRGYNLIDVKKYKLEFGATTEHVNDGIIPHTSTIFTGINFSDLDNPLKSFSFLHRSKDGESMGSSNVMEGSNSTSYWDFMIYTNPSSNMYRFDFGTKVQIVTATVPATGLLSVNILNGTNKIIKEGNVIASTTTTPVSLTGDIRINHSDANFDNKKVFQLHAIGKGFSDEEHALISSIFNNFLTKTGHL